MKKENDIGKKKGREGRGRKKHIFAEHSPGKEEKVLQNKKCVKG